jgi:hypothetical protein
MTGTQSTLPFDTLPDRRLVAVVLVTLVWTLGIALFAIGPHNRMPSRAAKTLPIDSLPNRPVMHLALARNQADIEAVLETANTSTKDKNIDSVRTGNNRDSLLLVPGYTLLFLSLSLLIARRTRTVGAWLFRISVAAALALAVADWVENYAIARVLSSATGGEAVSAFVRIPMVLSAFAKWTILGLLAIGLGMVAALQEWEKERNRRALSILLLLLGLATLATIGRHAVSLLPVQYASPYHSGRSASMTSTRDARAAGTRSSGS